MCNAQFQSVFMTEKQEFWEKLIFWKQRTISYHIRIVLFSKKTLIDLQVARQIGRWNLTFPNVILWEWHEIPRPPLPPSPSPPPPPPPPPPRSSVRQISQCFHYRDNLDWGQHMSEISSKASKTLGFLHRNLSFAPQETKEVAYKTLVRPKLEYAAAVWNP